MSDDLHDVLQLFHERAADPTTGLAFMDLLRNWARRTMPTYDAISLLGLGGDEPERKPLLLKVPDGLSLPSLRTSAYGREKLDPSCWYDKYPWSGVVSSGIFLLRLPHPDSLGKKHEGNLHLLSLGERWTPVVLVAAALLCIRRLSGLDPLNGGTVLCPEEDEDGCPVGVAWKGSRLRIYRPDSRVKKLWLSSYVEISNH